MTKPIVKADATGEGLYSTRSYAAGEVVFTFDQVSWCNQPDRFTVEHPNGRHFFDPVLAKTGHSCDPNCRVSIEDMAMIAIRDIAPGEAITFDYLTTESVITAPFDCACGAANCRGRIG